MMGTNSTGCTEWERDGDEKQVSGIIGDDGQPRAPINEDEACKLAIFEELTRQQCKHGMSPLISRPERWSVVIHVNIPELLDAIKRVLK